MTGFSSESVAAQLAAVRARIDAVKRPWIHEVEITAVTKGFAPPVVRAAATARCRSIGENYAQELCSKREVIESLETRPRIDFIGHLQSNKVRQIVALVDRWCTVDRPSIAKEIAKRASGAEVLIQVNSTAEPNKGGCAPEEVVALHDRCTRLGLNPLGLLTIGPTGQPPEAAAPGFRLVRALADDLELGVCSMGMSADLEVAVACGSTNVRIGSALFGPRPDRAKQVDDDGPVHHVGGQPG